MRIEPESVTNPRILVVEDEVIVARDIRAQLTGLGYEVVGVVATAEGAIEGAERLQPELVLMDISLSGEMDGITAATEIKDRFCLPVIFLTAYSGADVVERAKRAQPYGYLIKPFAEQELRITVEMAIYRHRSDEKLRESEARFRSLTDAAPDGIITGDMEGIITGWNRGAERVFGYQESEALGQPMTILMPERFRTAHSAGVLRVGAGEEKHVIGHAPVELVGRRRDGSEFPLELTLADWTTREGTFVTAIVRDVSDRKKVEEKVQLQSAALSAAINSVVITDVKGTIEWVNPAFCAITGYSFDEAVGQNPRVLKSGQQPAEYYRQMWRTIAAGKSWSGEFVNRRKNGTLYTESVSITPVKEESGKIAHYIAIKQDISALKRSLNDLNLAHDELSAKNSALDEALVEARAAGEAKAAFLSTMSHELRTPMNAVLGMASLLRETDPLSDLQKDYLDTISSSGDTLLNLINDVLDFTKIEADQVVLEQAPLNVRRSIEDFLEGVAAQAREKHLDLAAVVDPSVPHTVLSDFARLRQVLTHLVGNAIKFTTAGEVVLELSSEKGENDRHRLCFRVRDTGQGIPADKRDRLFKSFSQVDSSRTRLHGGTGLGLAISQRLVGLMGGKIQVSSEVGEGSVFFFDFEAEEVRSNASIETEKTPSPVAGRTVLVVDDNATYRGLFSKQLRQAKCHATMVKSGEEALDWLGKNTWPDVIVSDLQMPGMDGLDFTLQVRELGKARSIVAPIPVILVSSGGYRASDPRNGEAKIKLVLNKPLRQSQLLEAVAKACPVESQCRSDLSRKGLTKELRDTATVYPRKILVVEDNPVNRKMALGMLKRLGYEADVAVNGAVAVDMFGHCLYDLVLMDVQMPVMDGLEATRTIRGLPVLQPVILAVTANAMVGDREICLAAGMNGYMTKPVKLADLRAAIVASTEELSVISATETS